jgi:hypothetical protein
MTPFSFVDMYERIGARHCYLHLQDKMFWFVQDPGRSPPYV